VTPNPLYTRPPGALTKEDAMIPIRKLAAAAALIAAALVATGGATAGVAAAVGTDGYTWSNSTPTDAPAGGATDGYTWAD
jgi:hypothetical protein